MTRKSNIHGNLPIEDTADAEYVDAVKEKEYDTVSKHSRGGARTLSSYKNRLYKALRSSSNIADLLEIDVRPEESFHSAEGEGDEEAAEGEGDEDEKEEGEGDDDEEKDLEREQVKEYEDNYSKVMSR